MTPLDQIQKAAREQFDRQSANYGKSHILADVADVIEGLDGIAMAAGAHALDIATGGGHTALCLAKRGCDVTAADISEEMLKRAGELFQSEGYALKTRCHTAEALPDADGSYDIVTCRVAAHHFSDPPRFIAGVARVLKPGGYFLLIDGSVPDDEPEAAGWIHQVEKLRDPSHGRFLSPREWRALAEGVGMNVERCALHPFKQPDIEWYFETAATPLPNREAVRRLVTNAPDSARRAFRLGTEDGRTVWWWSRLTLLARKPVC